MFQRIIDIYASFFEKFPWVLSIFLVLLSLSVFTSILRLVFGFDSYSGLFGDRGSGFCNWFRSLWAKAKNLVMPYLLAFWDWLHVQDGKENSGE